MKLKSFFLLAAAYSVAGCQTFEALPEEARLATLITAPPDYTNYQDRRERDATAARSLGGYRGSRQLAKLADDEGYSILDGSGVLESSLKEFYAPLLPADLESNPNVSLPETSIYVAEQDGLDAHALNTGDIVVESGVLTKIDTFDEVNFVLAHESAHILLDHFRSDELKNAANMAASIAYVGALYADNQKNAASYRAGGGASAGFSYATLAVVGFSVLTNYLAVRREKQQEIEADQLGLEMLVDAPAYNSQLGASNLLARIVDGRTNQVEQEEDKIVKVEAELERVCGPKQSFGQLLLGEMLGGAATGVLDPNRPAVCQYRDQGLLQLDGELKEAQRSLEQMQERLDLMYDYQDVRYAEVENYPPVTKIETANGRNSFAALFDPDGPVIRLEEVSEVRARLEKNDCLGAQMLARQFLRGVEDDTFGPLREAYFDADVACNDDDPGRHAKIADGAGDASPNFLKKAYADYKARGKYEYALEMLEAYGARAGVPRAIYPDKILLLVRLGRDDEARTLNDACQTDDGFERALKRQCAARLASAISEMTAPASEGGGASSDIDLILATLSYDVMREAFRDEEVRALLPAQGDYVFYIPTDDAIRVAIDGDPRRLLERRNRRLLEDIVKSHIVRKSPETTALVPVSLTAAAADSPLPSVDIGHHSSVSELGLNDFEQHVQDRNGVIYSLGLSAQDGRAFLTDTVLLKPE